MACTPCRNGFSISLIFCLYAPVCVPLLDPLFPSRSCCCYLSRACFFSWLFSFPALFTLPVCGDVGRRSFLRGKPVYRGFLGANDLRLQLGVLTVFWRGGLLCRQGERCVHRTHSGASELLPPKLVNVPGIIQSYPEPMVFRDRCNNGSHGPICRSPQWHIRLASSPV